MLSRVAERIYWMARYLERAENTARLVTVYDTLLYDLPRDEHISWHNLIDINGAHETFHEYYSGNTERNVVQFLLADERNFSSLISSVKMIRENIRTSRDVVPQETWEIVNELYIYVRNNIKKGITRSGRHAFLGHVIESCQKISGLLFGNMSRNSEWHFVNLGRYLERADMTTRMLDIGTAIMLQPSAANSIGLGRVVWSKVLRSQGAYLDYRRTVRTSIKSSYVANYMLSDPAFPRSYMWCVSAIKEAVSQLPRYERLLPVIESLETLTFTAKTASDLNMDFRNYLNDLQIKLMTLDASVAETWFLRDQGDVA